ncbi:MAG: family 4C encapsulin nanocompartment shell protein [Rhodothermales bacterium]
MTIIEYAPAKDEILDFINDSIRQLQDAEMEPKYILLGVEAYERMRLAMGERFNREAGAFETYQFFPIIVDPLRKDTVCVLPSPAACADGVHVQRVEG